MAQKLEMWSIGLKPQKVEVKSHSHRKAELAEKLERLTELNALLSMDERGRWNRLDDAPENDGEQEELDTEEMGHDAEAVADAPQTAV